MKKLKHWASFLYNGEKIVNYLPWVCIPPIAMVVAFLFTYAQQSNTLWQTSRHTRFWIACAWSFLPALLILAYVQAITYILDVHFSWREMTIERIKRQVLYAVILPMLFLASFYSIYFMAYGKSIIKRKYFQIEFPMGAIAMMGLNLGYACHFLFMMGKQAAAAYEEDLLNEQREKLILLTKNREIKEAFSRFGNAREEDRKAYQKEITVNSGDTDTSIRVEHIICVLRWADLGAILMDDGTVYTMHSTLEYVRKLLDERIYAKCNRWCIVNLRHVAYTVTDKNNKNGKQIIYKKNTRELLESMQEKETQLLRKCGENSYRPSDKYLLNRSFWKNVDQNMEALKKEKV